MCETPFGLADVQAEGGIEWGKEGWIKKAHQYVAGDAPKLIQIVQF